jgi:hypothetical protein
MSGDPKACREQARDCLRLAHKARTTAARQTFSILASTWLSLASELEQRKAGPKVVTFILGISLPSCSPWRPLGGPATQRTPFSS